MESSCYKAEVEKLLKNPPAVDRSSYIATRNKIIVEVIQRLTCACLVHSSRTKSALKRRDGSFTSVQFFMLFSQLIISAAQRAGTIPNTTVGEVQACLNTDADENGWRTLLVRITTANNSLFRLLAAILHFQSAFTSLTFTGGQSQNGTLPWTCGLSNRWEIVRRAESVAPSFPSIRNGRPWKRWIPE